MSDSRDTANPDWVTTSKPMQIIQPVVDILRSPNGARDRQMLLGETATVLGEHEGHTYLRADKDGYIGFVNPQALGPQTQATHRVQALATHCYRDANMKSPDQMTLSHGSQISALQTHDTFTETTLGFIPKQHLSPIGQKEADPINVAKRYLGTPYLWGGNSRLGLDCSGLVQAALTACGYKCPGDSDQQERALGTKLADNSKPEKGDLFFWKGHVALVADEETLIHANAHHMAVAYENINAALQRIETAEGPRTSHIRL